MPSPIEPVVESPGESAQLEALLFAASHELRSPIGAISQYVSVLEEDHADRMDQGARAILARVRASARSALDVLDGLSRLSRIGRQALRPGRVDVEAVARDAFERIRPAGRRSALSIEKLPPAWGDAALLDAAFGELLANAVKFSSGESPRIVVDARCAPAGMITYRVTDDGVGFEQHFVGRLFEPFERLHSRNDFPGAGLGLALVRRVAERHGGSVAAEARPEGGARFSLILPDGAHEP
jgi:signal transduction histidine kinase